MDGRHFVRLIVAAVLAPGVISAESHQRVQYAPIAGNLDDRPARPIPPDDIAVLQDLPQQLAPPRPSPAPFVRPTPAATDRQGMVNVS